MADSTPADGEVAGDDREGTLRWWRLRERDRIDMPPADRYFFDPVVFGNGPPYERTFHYDTELDLVTAR